MLAIMTVVAGTPSFFRHRQRRMLVVMFLFLLHRKVRHDNIIAVRGGGFR
jgi:hypothetical protein